jgi:hypothetical protein
MLWLIWLLQYAALLFPEMALVKRAFDRLDDAIAYGIGGVSDYWLIERRPGLFCPTIGYGKQHNGGFQSSTRHQIRLLDTASRPDHRSDVPDRNGAARFQAIGALSR